MNRQQNRRGFTIIELLIVVIVIGILAAAGLAKYQNFAETSRRKSCLQQLQTIENAMGVWETTNSAFAESAKTAFGFSCRTGRLCDVAGVVQTNTAWYPVAINDDTANQPTVGAPSNFANANFAVGPLNSVIRDDKVWVCPSALSRYYGAEIQNVPDDYLDIGGGGVAPTLRSTPVGVYGRYAACIAGRGKTTSGLSPITNGGFPANWIAGISTATTLNTASPSPQTPFKLVICGCYGSFGPGSAANVPGTGATNQGGPVGPDGSSLNRHSARW